MHELNPSDGSCDCRSSSYWVHEMNTFEVSSDCTEVLNCMLEINHPSLSTDLETKTKKKIKDLQNKVRKQVKQLHNLMVQRTCKKSKTLIRFDHFARCPISLSLLFARRDNWRSLLAAALLRREFLRRGFQADDVDAIVEMSEFRDMSAAAAAAASSQTFPAQTSAISDPNSGGREREENVTMLLEDASDNQFRQVGGGDSSAAISGNGLGEKEKKKLNLALESAASDGDGILLESAVSDGGDGILLAVQREQEEEEEEQPVSVDGEIVSGGDNGEAEESREGTSEAVSDESLRDGRKGRDDLRENCGSSSSSSTPESCDLLLPADVGKHVMTLQCQSSAPGGICIVRIVGTAHVSKVFFQHRTLCTQRIIMAVNCLGCINQ